MEGKSADLGGRRIISRNARQPEIENFRFRISDFGFTFGELRFAPVQISVPMAIGSGFLIAVPEIPGFPAGPVHYHQRIDLTSFLPTC